ncbi:unnamed protein product [Effrenium voratum]|nr:unnamed protein product [Effrenium voratum]
MGQLQELRMLSLPHNHLSGGVPESFENLRHLTHLDLESNRLRLPLPRSMRHLSQLRSAELSGNEWRAAGPGPRQGQNCAPFRKDPCRQFRFWDLRECGLCVLSASAAAVGACLHGLYAKRSSEVELEAPAELKAPKGALEIAAAAVYPTTWGQVGYTCLAVVAQLFAPMVLAWFLNPLLVLVLMLLPRVAFVSGEFPLRFFCVGLSSFCAPRRSALAELAGLALAAAAVAALGGLQALRATHPRRGEVRASLLSEDSAQVAEIVGDFLVLVHFLHAVLFLTALRGLFLCCFLLKRRTSAAAVLDVQKLALALSSPSPGTAEEEDERPDGSPATLSMSSVAPDLVAMEMADGLQIFRKSSPQLVCQVRLLRPRKIYRHICMIVATSFTDLLVAMQFLEGHFFGFLATRTFVDVLKRKPNVDRLNLP